MTSPLLLALLSPSFAAELRPDLVSPGPGAPEARALLALPDVELGPAQQLEAAGGTTVRFEQHYQGLPVLGSGAAVRVAADGSVPLASTALRSGLRVDPTPELDLEQAVVVAEVQGRGARGELAVLPEGEGRLVWSLLVPGADGGERVLVDAHSGQVITRAPAALNSLGRVFAVNPVRTPETSDLELVSLDAPEHLNGWGGNFSVVNYVSGDPTSGSMVVDQSLGPSAGVDYLYDPPTDAGDTSDAFAQVSAFYHLTRARDYYAELTGLDFGEPSWKLVAAVNLTSNGSPLDNAFFSPAGIKGDFAAPNLIGIGQGAQLDFALDSDVFVHEFGHYVSQNAVGYNQGQLAVNSYGLFPWPGSVDEGIADYFACSFYDDPVLGEVVLSGLGAERDLSKVGGTCPDDIIGEVHEDGKLIGALGWDLREAYGAEVADQLVWGALTLMTAQSDLQDFGDGVREIGEELLQQGRIASTAELDAALATRGLDACGVVQDLDQGEMTTLVLGMDLLAGAAGVDCATLGSFVSLHSFFHFSATTSADDVGLRFDADMAPQTSGDMSWAIYARQGEHVGFEAGMLLPAVVDFDLVSDSFTGTSGSLVIEGDDFEPGQTWYGVVVHANCPNTQLTVSAEAIEDQPGDSDPIAESDPGQDSDPIEEPDPKGCGCGTAAPVSGGSLVGALVLLAAVRRRRS